MKRPGKVLERAWPPRIKMDGSAKAKAEKLLGKYNESSLHRFKAGNDGTKNPFWPAHLWRGMILIFYLPRSRRHSKLCSTKTTNH
jgi:hypothetical protein